MSILNVKKRTEIGKNRVNKLRAEGVIPGVIYGHGAETLHISLPAKDIEKFLDSNAIGAKVEVKIGRKKQATVLKEVKRNPVTRFVEHVDFQILKAGEKIKIQIPLHVINKESVEDKRTVVQETMHDIEITALPKNLIDSITVDVEGKIAGEQILVEDIQTLLPDGVEINEEADKIVVSIIAKSEEPEEEEEEEEEETTTATIEEQLEDL
ncbi:MAG: 50S ribosomal protein L25 [Bacillota bacterium]|nr:50S ribosomal protein L25 [Bacillota bacterium]